jgi:hypothetical protein
MRLPTKCGGDLGNRCAAFGLQHRNQDSLFAAVVLAVRFPVVMLNGCLGLGGFGNTQHNLRRRRCAQGDRPALFVVPINSVVVGRDNFFDQPVLEQALANIANGTPFEFGGDGKNQPVLAVACG